MRRYVLAPCLCLIVKLSWRDHDRTEYSHFAHFYHLITRCYCFNVSIWSPLSWDQRKYSYLHISRVTIFPEWIARLWNSDTGRRKQISFSMHSSECSFLNYFHLRHFQGETSKPKPSLLISLLKYPL